VRPKGVACLYSYRVDMVDFLGRRSQRVISLFAHEYDCLFECIWRGGLCCGGIGWGMDYLPRRFGLCVEG